MSVVDTISSPGGSRPQNELAANTGIGHDGVALLVADSAFYDFEALGSQTFAAERAPKQMHETSNNPYLSIHVQSPPHESSTHSLKFSLANTLFENGKRVTLFEDVWQRQRNGVLFNGRTELKSLALHLTAAVKDPSLAISAPLMPLTVPRRIKSSYGNILSELVTDESNQSISIPASKELTSSVMRFAELNPTSILSAEKPDVYALIIPGEALDPDHSGPPKGRHGMLYSGSAPTSDDAFLEHLWLNPSLITSGKFQFDLGRMISKGSAIRRVLGGGGEWGHRASLVALEHADEFEGSSVSSSHPVIDELNEDGDQKSSDLCKTLAPAGNFVQYFSVVHPEGVGRSQDSPSTFEESKNPSMSFSHIPIETFEQQVFGGHQSNRTTGSPNFDVPAYGRFGMSTSSQMSLQSTLTRSASRVETPLNVPYATVCFMSTQPGTLPDRFQERISMKNVPYQSPTTFGRSIPRRKPGLNTDLVDYNNPLVIRKYRTSMDKSHTALNQPPENATGSLDSFPESKGRKILPFQRPLVRKHIASQPSEGLDSQPKTETSVRLPSESSQIRTHTLADPIVRKVVEMPRSIVRKHRLPVTLQTHHFDNPMYEPVVKDHLIRSHYHRRLIRKHAATEERKSEYGAVGNPALQGVVRVRRRIHTKLIHLMMRVSAIRGIKGNIHEYEVPRRGKRHRLKVKGAIKHRYTDNVVWLKNPLQILRMVKDQRELEAQRNRAEGREDSLVVRTLREVADPNRHRIEVRDKAQSGEAPKVNMSDIDPKYLTTRELMRELYQELKRLKKEVIHYRK